ncbi:MAG: CbiX/SirB N-terminal domain-containing protein [Bdellovibrionota bacterium]
MNIHWTRITVAWVYFLLSGAALAQDHHHIAPTAPKPSVAIVLAQHGQPATDVPAPLLGEYFGLMGHFHYGAPLSGQENMSSEQIADLENRFHDVETQIVEWCRNPMNDKFWLHSYYLAEGIQNNLGYPVLVGFNEFCNPTLEDALLKAASQTTDRVIMVTPMLTPGGGHPEHDLPKVVGKVQDQLVAQESSVEITYIWPRSDDEISTWIDHATDLVVKQLQRPEYPQGGTIVFVQHGVPIRGYESRKALQQVIGACNDDPSSQICQNYLSAAKQDKYWISSERMRAAIETKTGRTTYVANNEFSYPDLGSVLRNVGRQSAAGEKITVVNAMLTQGGDHGKDDIPNTIAATEKELGESSPVFVSAWPFEEQDVVDFLTGLIESHLE